MELSTKTNIPSVLPDIIPCELFGDDILSASWDKAKDGEADTDTATTKTAQTARERYVIVHEIIKCE